MKNILTKLEELKSDVQQLTGNLGDVAQASK